MSALDETPAREPVNILLVDDNPAKLLSYEAILGDLGENLLIASSGTEALEQFLKHDIAVVLLDVCMPDLDGFELAAMLRQHPRHARTAIIFISAVHLTDLDRLRGYESGAVDYVPVPVVPEILRARVGVFAELHRKTRQLERWNRELEARVTARTAELEASTERLRASEERLREVDRRKDEFLAMLAHELRNPLSPIRNAVEVLGTHGDADTQLTWARDIIDRQVRHMARLVDDLLDVSRITRAQLVLRRERIDLAAVLATAIESSRRGFEERRHTLAVDVPDAPMEIDGDFVRLSQVFSNLLDNAAKYTPENGRITLHAAFEPGACVVSVRDSGVGIGADDLPHIFELFYQTTASRSANGGLGIGLTLVHRLLELHGGSVEARSPGLEQGSEFVVRLPLAASISRPAVVPDIDPKAPPRRVLVVDDNEDSAVSLARLLQLSGHEVATAFDGQAAIEEAERFRPDVVLLDLGLPNVSGYDACRRMRAEIWGRSLCIVAVTGWGQEEDRRRTTEAGFDAHVTKPVERSVLTRLLAELPRHSRPAAEPAAEAFGGAPAPVE